MNKSFENLPTELIQSVLLFLSPSDFYSLRYTNRNTKKKTDYIFYKGLARRTVKLNTQAVEKFVRACKQGLGRHLRHCTLIRRVTPWNYNRRSLVGFCLPLVQAFHNLKKYCPHGMLSSLHITIEVHDRRNFMRAVDSGPAWNDLWIIQENMFQLTTEALRLSSLSLHELDIFGSSTTTKDVCLGSHFFFEAISLQLLTHSSFASVEKLVLSLAACIHTLSVLRDFLQVFSIMPCLSSLDLRLYIPRKVALSASPLLNQSTIDRPPAIQTNNRLEECILCGVFASKHDLLQFLQIVQPVSLTLMGVCSEPGTFASLVKQPSITSRPLKYCHLNADGESENPNAETYLVGPCSLTKQMQREVLHLDDLPAESNVHKPDIEHWGRRALLYGPADFPEIIRYFSAKPQELSIFA